LPARGQRWRRCCAAWASKEREIFSARARIQGVGPGERIPRTLPVATVSFMEGTILRCRGHFCFRGRQPCVSSDSVHSSARSSNEGRIPLLPGLSCRACVEPVSRPSSRRADRAMGAGWQSATERLSRSPSFPKCDRPGTSCSGATRGIERKAFDAIAHLAVDDSRGPRPGNRFPPPDALCRRGIWREATRPRWCGDYSGGSSRARGPATPYDHHGLPLDRWSSSQGDGTSNLPYRRCGEAQAGNRYRSPAVP
jgi:hypothetical protein